MMVDIKTRIVYKILGNGKKMCATKTVASDKASRDAMAGCNSGPGGEHHHRGMNETDAAYLLFHHLLRLHSAVRRSKAEYPQMIRDVFRDVYKDDIPARWAETMASNKKGLVTNCEKGRLFTVKTDSNPHNMEVPMKDPNEAGYGFHIEILTEMFFHQIRDMFKGKSRIKSMWPSRENNEFVFHHL